MREKNLSKINTDIPPPGFYYDPEKESCLNTKKKPIEFQCFDSTAPRFAYPLDLNPGVGDYKLISVNDIKKPGQIFNKEPKKDALMNKQALLTPGVGHYEIKLDILQEKVSHKPQPVSHPSVFGSGSYSISIKLKYNLFTVKILVIKFRDTWCWSLFLEIFWKPLYRKEEI